MGIAPPHNIPVIDDLAWQVYVKMPGHNTTFIPGKLIGALRVLSQIRGAIPLIHGPIGCSFQRKLCNVIPGPITYYTPCTRFSQFEVIYGGENALKSSLIEVYERFKPDLIAVLTTCASDMTGDDVKAVIDEVKGKGLLGDCKVIYSTGDFAKRFRQVGAQDVLYAITDQLIVPETEGQPLEEKSVNLMSEGLHGSYEIDELKAMLDGCGVKVNKVYFKDVFVRDLPELGLVELNITPYYQLWAELLNRKRGVKHYCLARFDNPDPDTQPIGLKGFGEAFMGIAKVLGVEGEAEDVLKRRLALVKEELDKVKESLKGVKVAIEGLGFSGATTLLPREFEMKISVLIFWTTIFKTLGLSEKALEKRINIHVEYARRYGSDPKVLIDPSPDEALRAIKAEGVKLILTRRAYFYHVHGFKAVDLSQMLKFGHFSIGMRPTVEIAKILRRALDSKSPARPILKGLETSSEIPYLTPQWAHLAKLFSMNRRGMLAETLDKEMAKIVEMEVEEALYI
ncbi:MAG: nitrogenase component 1 [Candidatus Nezhaarchaeales archaeon]